jgi:hypothetical protein
LDFFELQATGLRSTNVRTTSDPAAMSTLDSTPTDLLIAEKASSEDVPHPPAPRPFLGAKRRSWFMADKFAPDRSPHPPARRNTKIGRRNSDNISDMEDCSDFDSKGFVLRRKKGPAPARPNQGSQRSMASSDWSDTSPPDGSTTTGQSGKFSGRVAFRSKKEERQVPPRDARQHDLVKIMSTGKINYPSHLHDDDDDDKGYDADNGTTGSKRNRKVSKSLNSAMADRERHGLDKEQQSWFNRSAIGKRMSWLSPRSADGSEEGSLGENEYQPKRRSFFQRVTSQNAAPPKHPDHDSDSASMSAKLHSSGGNLEDIPEVEMSEILEMSQALEVSQVQDANATKETFSPSDTLAQKPGMGQKRRSWLFGRDRRPSDANKSENNARVSQDHSSNSNLDTIIIAAAAAGNNKSNGTRPELGSRRGSWFSKSERDNQPGMPRRRSTLFSMFQRKDSGIEDPSENFSTPRADSTPEPRDEVKGEQKMTTSQRNMGERRKSWFQSKEPSARQAPSTRAPPKRGIGRILLRRSAPTTAREWNNVTQALGINDTEGPNASARDLVGANSKG